ncbi:cyclase family protein [Dyella silvatica]|uniref:cyclase family protein n=1 Tax=Dyella silvatica TaxID=2992128 RepID=UPI00225219B5|nr:cyclase family protein [Dyella silvatica]
MSEQRVCFDFEIDFSNGGGIQGQDFRLDIAADAIHADDISDNALAAIIVNDLRLLMVGEVRILHKRIIQEQHKRAVSAVAVAGAAAGSRFADLSHVIEDGMVTYKGLPAPLICDHLSRVESRGIYAPGTEFQIGRIEMVGGTGTYIDTPYHRYAGGHDLSGLALERVSDVPGVVARASGMLGRSIDWSHFAALDVRGRAVLVHTGWSTHWRTDGYFEGHPFLTRAAAEYLRDQGALLVGIDSMNIDDTSDGERPVHSVLLAAGIPIVEHLTNLAALPLDGFRFSAVPPKIAAMGTFPVRAPAHWQG